MMGETPTTRSRRRRSTSRTPGTASNGSMDTTGFDGQTTTVPAPPGRRARRARAGPGRRLEPDPGHGHVVAEVHEVLLEADLGPVHQLQPGSQRVVGHRDDADAHPARAGQLAGDLAQRGAFAEPLSAVEVGGQVPVAEVEPGDPAQPASDSMTRQDSPARPQPVSGLMASASV